MKYFRSVSLLVLLFAASWGCKKSAGENEVEETGGELTGNWELAQSAGGMMPLTNFPPGNGHGLHFDGSHYKIFRNGQVVHEGSYQLRTDSLVDVRNCDLLPPASSNPNRIVYDNELFVRNYFVVTGNTLKISTGCIPLDGGWSLYKRKHSVQ